jgi:hypothetical protein
VTAFARVLVVASVFCALGCASSTMDLSGDHPGSPGAAEGTAHAQSTVLSRDPEAPPGEGETPAAEEDPHAHHGPGAAPDRE